MSKDNQRTHALLSASSSERWLNCTPSARIESVYPETKSIFADEGTKAHDLCETYILAKLNVLPQFAVDVKNKEAPLDMQAYAREYTDYVMSLSKDVYKIGIEEKLNLNEYIPEGLGTCDAYLITKDTLHIIDFKYGMGVWVNAFDNPQLKIYALGVISNYEIFYDIPDNVTLHIYQPRLNNISTFNISTSELLEWAENILKPTAKKAYDGSGEKTVGKWCKFCKHKNDCKTRFDKFIKILKMYEK